MGKIDKVKYDNFDNKTIVEIVDYKTGNPNIDIDNIIYGLDMQLPIYIYLIKNSKLINIEIAGFYLQKILHNKPNYEKNKTIEDILSKLYRLEGYSNSDTNILSKVDSEYVDSKVIKGMKMSSKGFYNYTKILDNNQINKIENIVDKNIENAIKDIKQVDFSINPKRINLENVGCKFCKFQDICYMKEENIVNLKKQSYKEFLGDINE